MHLQWKSKLSLPNVIHLLQIQFWEFVITSKQYPLGDGFVYSHHLSAVCIDIVGRNKILTRLFHKLYCSNNESLQLHVPWKVLFLYCGGLTLLQTPAHQHFLEKSKKITYINLASYAHILWARHAIFLPHKRLLKPREHSLPFVCLHPGLCLKDRLAIMWKLL